MSVGLDKDPGCPWFIWSETAPELLMFMSHMNIAVWGQSFIPPLNEMLVLKNKAVAPN